jgi:hypothetical protein
MTINTSREAVEELAKFCDTAWVQRGPQAALFLRALARERDVALAQARYIAKALEAAANHRDEALAQVAALMDLVRETALHLGRVSDYDAPRLLLRVNAAVSEDAAAARDAALIKRGQRETYRVDLIIARKRISELERETEQLATAYRNL